MIFPHAVNTKFIASFRRCTVGGCAKCREHIIFSQEVHVVANQIIMTKSSVAFRDRAFIVPDKATFVFPNEPAKRQHRLTTLHKENHCVTCIFGGNADVCCCHNDHGSVTPKGFPDTPSHDTDSRLATTANVFADILVCQGFAKSRAAAAFRAAASFAFGTGIGAAFAGATCSFACAAVVATLDIEGRTDLALQISLALAMVLAFPFALAPVWKQLLWGLLGLGDDLLLVAVHTAQAVRAGLSIAEVKASKQLFFFRGPRESSRHRTVFVKLVQLLALLLNAGFLKQAVASIPQSFICLVLIPTGETIHLFGTILPFSSGMFRRLDRNAE